MSPFRPITAIEPPVLYPDQIREWLRLGSSGEDTTIRTLLQSAIDWAENYCDQPLFARQFEAMGSSLCHLTLRGISPRSVTVQTSTNGVDYADYAVTYSLHRSGQLCFDVLPAYVSGTTYRVHYTAGYDPQGTDGSMLTIPADLQTALLIYIATQYERRAETVAERVTSTEKLLNPYKRYTV